MKMTRYCCECGSIGDVPASAINCCPDGSHAAVIPEDAAIQARAGFLRSLELADTATTMQRCARFMEMLAEQVDPAYRITLILRHTDSTDGRRDVLFTNDDFAAAVAAGRRTIELMNAANAQQRGPAH